MALSILQCINLQTGALLQLLATQWRGGAADKLTMGTQLEVRTSKVLISTAPPRAMGIELRLQTRLCDIHLTIQHRTAATNQ